MTQKSLTLRSNLSETFCKLQEDLCRNAEFKNLSATGRRLGSNCQTIQELFCHLFRHGIINDLQDMTFQVLKKALYLVFYLMLACKQWFCADYDKFRIWISKIKSLQILSLWSFPCYVLIGAQKQIFLNKWIILYPRIRDSYSCCCSVTKKSKANKLYTG